MSSPITSQSAPCLASRLFDYNFYGGFFDIFSFEPAAEHHCHHVFNVNRDRTFMPQAPGVQPNDFAQWTLALTCQRCRAHVDVQIDFADSHLVCPTHIDPFHHFVFLEPQEPVTDDYPRKYHFKCSSEKCAAIFSIVFRAPELRTQEIEYLLHVQPRLQAVTQVYPDTRQRNPLEALHVFRSYIQGCLDNKSRAIPTKNTTFMSVIGEGGTGILRRLGFTLGKNDEGQSVWLTPKPPAHDTTTTDIIFDMHRCELEDIREELTVLMQGRPPGEKRSQIPDIYAPPPGDSKMAFSTFMGIPDYKRASPTQHNLEMQRQEPYIGLGALPDFDDTLISWCYDRQTHTFEGHVPFYFRCLKEISQDRQSEELATKTMTLESQGVRTDSEIREAWNAIGISPNHYHLLNDNNILSSFQSRYQDTGASERQRMLHALSIIADSRGSAMLKDAANGTLETYEQALVFLGAEADTSDAYILSLKTVKVSRKFPVINLAFQARLVFEPGYRTIRSRHVTLDL